MFDIVIRGGRIYDGMGTPSFQGDLAISGDRIISIGDVGANKGVMTIEADGLAVAPGFIDIHAHSDFTILADPSGEGKVMQGVTTEVNGNCGLSAAPLYGEAFERRKGDLEELGLDLSWHDLMDYFDLVSSKGTTLNVATLVGHGNLRGSVVGYGDRRPTATEMEEMKSLLRDSLKAGALGLSTGLIYPPGVYSDTEELTGLASIVGEFGGIYASHMRSEGDRLLESITEAISIGREGGVPVQISHLKTAGEKNWHKLDAALELIEAARGEGLDATADRYPYAASNTDLDALLPSWVYEGGNEEELKRLSDGETRGRIRQEILARHERPEYWDKVMVASVGSENNKRFEGLLISQIAREMGKEPVDALFDLLIEERLRVSGIFFSMSEENLRRILRKPYVMVGSDASARGFSGPTRIGKPHPRTFGTFPRVLSKFVREEKILSLEDGIRKMTSMPAEKLRLKDRGVLKAGAYADIVIFDPAVVADEASYQEPYRRPKGISHVTVNGQIVLNEGGMTGRRPGRVLSRSEV